MVSSLLPDFPLVRRGKVREVFRLPTIAPVSAPSAPTTPNTQTATPPLASPSLAAPEGRLLMVASDRISAFDVVMPTPIPGKGRLLTEISAWWFAFLQSRGICQSHLISTDAPDIDAAVGPDPKVRSYLRGRSTICRACEVIPVECVVRGYLEGSGWKEYQATGSVCGVSLPAGLKQCDKLPEPIFTPATKAAVGHDENISFDHAAELIGLETAAVVRDLSLSIYKAASQHALSRGIIIADTKFEFGIPVADLERAGRAWVPPILIDEAITPDSSRFWPARDYKPGKAQKSFDKQFLREYLEELAAAGTWDKNAPGPELPEAVIAGTLARYREARDLLCT